MTNQILGLRTVIYKVSDLNEAKQWYADVFLTQPYFDEPFYVGFNIAGYELGLMPDDTPSTQKTTNVMSYWGVENIAREFTRFIQLGAVEDCEPTSVGGKIMVASLTDPWGNVIGLIYNPDFALDQDPAT